MFGLMALCVELPAGGQGTALRLHPRNPHYFEFRGRPVLLITSGEHYGAVLNSSFDYKKYLATLAKDGLNLTRVFSGAYVEPSGAFNIAANTLAPGEGAFLAPWERSVEPGYAGGGNRFDLAKFSSEYFERLHAFMEEASRQGVVVEFNLFCPFYGEEQWVLSPMNASNNVNEVGRIVRTDAYTVDRSGALLEFQKAMVRKVVTELNRYDNLYFEICNEPYFGGVTLEWQYLIASEIVQAESRLPNRHLVSRNVANAGIDQILAGNGKVWKEEPAISILNFHYANPPLVVPLNYGLQRVIGENETGFHGTDDAYYRREAWEFILGGGGLFNHLDYSFTVGHEEGDFQYPPSQPGGGSVRLRQQLGSLKAFLESLDFVAMAPDNTLILNGIAGFRRAQVLAAEGREYAVFVRDWKEPSPTEQNEAKGPLRLELALPTGRYRVEWLDPETGRNSPGGELRVSDQAASLEAPFYAGEIALRIQSLQ